MKKASNIALLVSVLALMAVGVSAQRQGATPAPAPAPDNAERRPANAAAAGTPEDGTWVELGDRRVNGARDRDSIRVARRHNPLTHVLVRVQESDIEIYDMVITFADGTTFSPELRLTFREGGRSRRIDLPGNARVVRKVDFRYGNLPGGGNARVELLGQE